MTRPSEPSFGDPIAFSARVAGDLPGPGYSALDRYHDFRHAFLDGAQGRRVLAQLLTRCQLWERSYAPGDPYETVRREGMRDIGLWIMEIVNFEPPDPPADHVDGE